MLPEAHLVHVSPGRVRIKIPLKRGDGEFFSSLREQLAKLPMVQNVEVNPLTGSVLVHHNFNGAEVDYKAISDYTELSGLFTLAKPNADPIPVRNQIVALFESANDKVKGATAGELDLPTTASLGLLGMGLYQLGKGNVGAPAWHVAFWYALNTFLQGRREGMGGVPRRPGDRAGEQQST
jgi:hypothetical protein